MRIRVVENGHTTIELDVVALPENLDEDLVSRGVEIHFKAGQWVCTYPGATDTDALPDGRFDQSAMEPRGIVPDYEEMRQRFYSDWIRTGNCPDPNFYEVTASTWIEEVGARCAGCRHFVLVGHDMWMEVLAHAMSWKWTEPSATWLDPLNLPSPKTS
ncbi:hypothetical protein [Chondromyces crocatus]|uniref:hypothetical protein n=1 Tax=Chondromyces crocatus TaxID=52 RepID=UPI0012E1A30F|nr:hypothetical protein [Chondromyces crocatus]